MIQNDKIDIINDAIEVVFGSTWVSLNDMPEEEAAEVLKMTVTHTKFVKVGWLGW